MVQPPERKMSHLQVPPWASKLYGLMIIVLVPWVVNLADTLPSRHVDRHWDTVWVGFDTLMLLLIALTTWFIIRRAVWFIVSASALGAFFVVDAWFDVLTAQPGSQRHHAIGFAIVEIVLAALTYWLVYRVVRFSVLGVQVPLPILNRSQSRK